MTKLTNINTITPDLSFEEWADRENQNFQEIADRVGLEFARATVTIVQNKWVDNRGEQMPDINNLDQSVQNTARTPAFRAVVTVKFPAPYVNHVRYTDVLVGPHHEVTDKFAEQLQEITLSNVIFVAHSDLEKFNDHKGEGEAPLNLMFWAIASRPKKDLAFDVVLV